MLFLLNGGIRSDGHTSLFSADACKRPLHLVCYTCESVVSVFPVHLLVHLANVCCGCPVHTVTHLHPVPGASLNSLQSAVSLMVASYWECSAIIFSAALLKNHLALSLYIYRQIFVNIFKDRWFLKMSLMSPDVQYVQVLIVWNALRNAISIMSTRGPQNVIAMVFRL